MRFMPIMPLRPYVPEDPYGREAPLAEGTTGDEHPTFHIAEGSDDSIRHRLPTAPTAIIAAARGDVRRKGWNQGQVHVRPHGMHCEDERKLLIVIDRYEDWISRESDRMRWYFNAKAYIGDDALEQAHQASLREVLGMDNLDLEDLNAKRLADLRSTLGTMLETYWQLIKPTWSEEMPLRKREQAN